MDAQCSYIHLGLIVTGRTEEAHLPKLFRSLMETGICYFEIIRFIGQRGPITSESRRLEIVGSGQAIPSKDEEEISLPTRRYLADGCRLVVLVDDLERRRRRQAQEIFDRYRQALDLLLSGEQKRRASMHFLVNMLEAYYFADADALNAALGFDPPLRDYEGDVETIRNPKSELKKLYSEFDEKDGGVILDHLDIEHGLSCPDTCAWLRTLFAWCVAAMEQFSSQEFTSLHNSYRLQDGHSSPVTAVQLDSLRQGARS